MITSSVDTTTRNRKLSIRCASQTPTGTPGAMHPASCAATHTSTDANQLLAKVALSAIGNGSACARPTAYSTDSWGRHSNNKGSSRNGPPVPVTAEPKPTAAPTTAWKQHDSLSSKPLLPPAVGQVAVSAVRSSAGDRSRTALSALGRCSISCRAFAREFTPLALASRAVSTVSSGAGVPESASPASRLAGIDAIQSTAASRPARLPV